MARYICHGLIFLLLSACSPAPYQGLPALPVKDWLAQDAGEDGKAPEKLKLYSPDKVMTFEDLVWLAIQQSPAISRGKIGLEIQEINKRDVNWRYLPEIHLFYTISNNLTRKNEGNPQAGSDYGQTAYELNFGGSWNNPVATYLSGKAQDELMQVAIVTQRKAIADVIFRIAQSLLRINMLEKNITLLEDLEKAAAKRSAYSRVMEKHVVAQSSQAFYDEEREKSAALQLRETRMELTVARTRLKQLVGLNLRQALKIDPASVYPVLASFKPEKMDWQEGWRRSETAYLAHEQVRLEQANIMLAWAQYLPNVSVNINENPPKGQSQPNDASSDEFLHLGLDFPIFDWGHRWRQAQIASVQKRQKMLDEIQLNRDYEEQWLINEQNLMLARARIENRRQLAAVAERRTSALETAFNGGQVSMEFLGDHWQRALHAKMALLQAEYAESMARLDWMHLASGLSIYFLGQAGYVKGDSQ